MAEWPLVNQTEQSVSVDFHHFCEVIPEVSVSPIDEYYERASVLIVKAAGVSISSDPILMRLLFVELIASAESYFRNLLAGVINVCPIVKVAASRRQLALGALDYYTSRQIGLGLTESASLSGEGELKRQTIAITGFDIKPQSSVGVALTDFEKICHLRHAVVHACGELGSRNLAEIGIQVTSRQRAKIDNTGFQIIAAKIHNAVRAYNSFLFDSIVKGWLRNEMFSWAWPKDRSRFIALHRLFYSSQDGAGDPNPREAYVQLRKTVKS